MVINMVRVEYRLINFSTMDSGGSICLKEWVNYRPFLLIIKESLSLV